MYVVWVECVDGLGLVRGGVDRFRCVCFDDLETVGFATEMVV